MRCIAVDADKVTETMSRTRQLRQMVVLLTVIGVHALPASVPSEGGVQQGLMRPFSRLRGAGRLGLDKLQVMCVCGCMRIYTHNCQYTKCDIHPPP